MIEPAVAKLSLQFQRAVRMALGDSPSCLLDFTWPSVGLVDHLLYRLRKKQEFEENDLSFIRGAAAYLACMAHDCWCFFPGKPKVELRFADEQSLEVVLEASGGELLVEGQRVAVAVTQELMSLLQQPPRTLSFFGKFSRNVLPEDNLLSLFALGLLSGYSPAIKGRWSTMGIGDYSPNLTSASLFLAHGCAVHYKNIYPHEPIGQEPALYLADLILPPTSYAEPFPLMRTTASLGKYFAEHPYSKEAQASVFVNLAASTDDLLASAGFVMATGSTADKPSRRLLGLASGFVGHAPSYLSAVADAREHFGLPRHWLTLLKEEQLDKARVLFETERQLNMLPLACASSAYVTDPALRPVFEAVSLSNPTLLREIIQKLRVPLPRDICCLEAVACFALGDSTGATNLLQSLNEDGTCALAHELLGSAAYQSEHYDEANTLLSRAYAAPEDDSFLKLRRGEHLARCLEKLGKNSDALVVVEELIAKFSSPLTLLVQQYRLLKKQNALEKSREVREQITNRGVINRSTFPIFLQAGIQEAVYR